MRLRNARQKVVRDREARDETVKEPLHFCPDVPDRPLTFGFLKRWDDGPADRCELAATVRPTRTWRYLWLLLVIAPRRERMRYKVREDSGKV